MTDEELLELAAKAAGFAKAKWQDMRGWGELRYGLSEAIWTGEDYWNPLTDDGDALRLAVKLAIRVETKNDFAFVNGDALDSGFAVACDDDPYAATRRAVVRAAAEIGKGMK